VTEGFLAQEFVDSCEDHNISNVVRNSVQNLRDRVSNIGQNMFAGAVSRISGAINNVFSGIQRAVSSLVSGIGTAVSGVMSGIGGLFGGGQVLGTTQPAIDLPALGMILFGFFLLALDQDWTAWISGAVATIAWFLNRFTGGGGGGDDDITPVQSISISGNAGMTNGSTQNLTATTTPASASNNANWEIVSGANVVSFSGGSSNTRAVTIRANATGSARIRATSVTGNRTAYHNVTVTAAVVPNVPVTGISLNRTTASILTTETLTLNATVTPNNATNRNVT